MHPETQLTATCSWNTYPRGSPPHRGPRPQSARRSSSRNRTGCSVCCGWRQTDRAQHSQRTPSYAPDCRLRVQRDTGGKCLSQPLVILCLPGWSPVQIWVEPAHVLLIYCDILYPSLKVTGVHLWHPLSPTEGNWSSFKDWHYCQSPLHANQPLHRSKGVPFTVCILKISNFRTESVIRWVRNGRYPCSGRRGRAASGSPAGQRGGQRSGHTGHPAPPGRPPCHGSHRAPGASERPRHTRPSRGSTAQARTWRTVGGDRGRWKINTFLPPNRSCWLFCYSHRCSPHHWEIEQQFIIQDINTHRSLTCTQEELNHFNRNLLPLLKYYTIYMSYYTIIWAVWPTV